MANPTVSYLDENGVTQTITEYTLVTDSSSAVNWSTGYYVVGADYNDDGLINGDDAAYAKEESLKTEFTISNKVSIGGAQTRNSSSRTALR